MSTGHLYRGTTLTGSGARLLAVTLSILLATASLLAAPSGASAAPSPGPTEQTEEASEDPDDDAPEADERTDTGGPDTGDASEGNGENEAQDGGGDATDTGVASLLHDGDSPAASTDGNATDSDTTDPTDAPRGPPVDDGTTIDPLVTTTLEEHDEVGVIIRLREQPDADAIGVEASRAARAAAQQARERGQARGADGGTIAAEARQAAHEARVTTVVEHLQTLADDTNDAVADLLAEREAAGQVTDVLEYWIFNGFAANVDADTLDDLAAHPDVAHISLDRTLEVPEVESSPRLPTWSLEAVNAPDTWGDLGIRGEGITIGVLDTGVDGDHPALAGSYRGRDGDHTANWYVPTGENYPTPGDGHGHGTHVTGSITGGPPGDVIGVAPDAEWLGVKIFNDAGATNDSIIADGMQWILAPGGDPANAPHIVNNSWGHPDSTNTTYWDEVDAWVAAGIFPVFANGNNGPGGGTVGSPASFPNSFGVGATDRNDVIAGFSSRGPAFWDGERYLKPQVSAPGHEIYSAWPTHTGQDYHTISGTSMAAPHAAGVAALVLSAAPDLALDDLRDVLQDTVRTEAHMGSLPDDAYGHGILDAYAATQRVTIAGIVEGTITGPDGPIEATVSVPAEGLSTTSDPESGDYELFVPEGEHVVVVEAYGYVTDESTVTIEAGEITTLDVQLAVADTATLSGTVTSDGAPLPGASVSVPGTPLDPVRTDDDGAFAFEIAHGTYEVRATAHGHLPGNAEVVVDGDTSVTLDLEPLDQTAAPGWREHQNDAAGTGFVDEHVAPDTLDELWTAELGATVMFSSPVIADDRVYITTENGRLHALDAQTGESDWSFATGGTQRSTPAVTDDTVYVGGAEDSTLYALDLDGSPRWTYDTGDEMLVYATPTEVDGTVYVATGFGQGNGGFVHAIDAATGERQWRGEVGTQIFFGPVVADGTVIAASRDDNRVVAFDADSGDELWSTTHDETFVSMPAIADGTLYLATSTEDFTSGSVLALDAATGETQWHTTGHGDTQGNSPVIYGDLVILGSHSHGTVSAYDRTSGERQWSHIIGTAVTSAQLVTAGGVVFGGSQDGQVWALDASTGDRLWDHATASPVLSAPAAGEGLTVFADRGGNVTAFVSTGTVQGTVTGPDGPLEATLRIAETDVETTSDPDTGAYELAHQPGTYTLEVRAYGYAQQDTEVTIEVGTTTTVDLDLEAVDDGSIQGTITDEGGTPLEGAEVTLQGSGLDPAVTDADGDYAFPNVAEGTYDYLADADGYAPQDGNVEVVAGETTTLDVTLTRYDIAVVSDHEGAITDILDDAGWRVDRVTFEQIDGNTDRYGAIVLSGHGDDRTDADLDRLQRIIDDADEAGTSLIVLDQWSLAYGSLRPYAQVTGQPGEVDVQYTNQGAVWLEEVVDHPITASLPDTDRVPLLTSGHHAWFHDYDGLTLGTLGADQTGHKGGGIGYEPRTFDSNHVLLPSHAPTPWAGPDINWQAPMTDLLIGSVGHAVTAEYGEVAGTVTDTDGAPTTANVEVVGGLTSTSADEDGGYALLLEPGEHTLRFSALGHEPVEQTVDVVAGETVTVDVELPDSGLGTIGGTVTDGSTGSGIADVEVTVLGTDLDPVTTDSDGTYAVDGVPGGTYDVTFDADGYLPLVLEDVEVVEGEVTTLDAQLESAPTVAIVGDRTIGADEGVLADFLIERSIPAFNVGWEITDELDDVDVVVLHNPDNITDQAEFLAHLDAFDEAGVSVVFPADGWASRTRGIDLLVRHTGNPSDYGRLGGFSGPEIYLHDLADHPVFAGIDDDPAQLLTAASEAAYFTEYDGVHLADVAEVGEDPAGIGVAYEPRTTDSVHLLLSGLAATFRNHPDENWTDAGQQIFLNAIRWAASPQLGVFQGTVADPDEEPIEGAVVEVEGTEWSATTDAGGSFAVGVPPGEYTLTYEAFGYVGDERELTVEAGQTVDASIQLDVADVGAIEGTVTSSGNGIDPDASPTTTLEGVEVRLTGTPLTTVTDEDGTYRFDRVVPGEHELEVETEGHVRKLADVEVETDQTTQRDIVLRVSPEVGVIDDSDYSNSRDRAKLFLEDWGYLAEDVDWDDLDRISELDLVVANISDFPNPDPGEAGFAAFMDVVNRAGIPVLWMDQHGRGSIQYLQEYDGDPTERGEGWNDGAVTATVVEDHPLVAGLPDSFDLLEENRRYAYFDGFSGTTVATLSTDDGEMGSTLGYRGRTAGTVDVLASTLTATTWGAPSVPGENAHFWTPEAERVYVNALAWALDADGIGAEVRGIVQDEDGNRITSEVEVLETGRTAQGREGDGSFVLPLDPGTWTLEVSSFAFETTTYEVTVEAGEIDRPTITLDRGPAGDIVGEVTVNGSPLEGATVSVLDTPRSTETASDGSYTLSTIPEGEWTVEFRAPGFQVERVDVTVEDGEVHTVNVDLGESTQVAVAGDNQDRVSGLLTDEGYDVDTYAYAALDDIADAINDYTLVILNGTGTNPDADTFTDFLAAAEAADVSVIFPSQFGSSPMRHLSDFTGDPESVTQGFRSEEIAYTVLSEHPIFDGYDVGETVTILENPGQNQQFQYYSDYSGETIARTDAPAVDEELGDGLGYRFASSQSVHVLLGNLAVGTYGAPDTRWTEDAATIYLNAVAWAIDASQGEVVGEVTSDGEPLEGATVTAVEADTSTSTGSDGTYQLGLPEGTHTLEASLEGYETATETVTLGDSGQVTVDFELERLPRGQIEVLVSDAEDDAPISDAEVAITGPMDRDGTTDDQGQVLFEDLLEGDYEVEVNATGYLTQTTEVSVVADERAGVEVSLSANDVAVLGDVDEALTDLLRDEGVAAEERTWADLAEGLGPYEVVFVNGGEPTEDAFTAVLDAADDAGASLIFTGTWGVDQGGIRLLEEYTEDVTVGGHGYGDGPVSLTGIDDEHPLFDGLDAPESRIVADDGYYSWLDHYVGHHLADLAVDGAELGLAIAYDFRGEDHVHLLLSMAAVTDVMGPGYGWTDETSTLVTNAVGWVRDIEQEAPEAPTLETDADEVGAEETVEVYGEAEFRSTVTILREGEAIATTEPDRDGTYNVEVELIEGENVLVAEAANHAGGAPSEPLILWLDTTGPVLEWTPEDGDGFFDPTITVAGTAHDEPAGVDQVTVNGEVVAVDDDGAWSTEVTLDEGANEVTVAATDTLGNETVETRTVAYVALDAEWQLPPRPGAAVNVQLHVTDEEGTPTEVDGAELEAVNEDGTVTGPYNMRWSDERYQYVLRNLPSGDNQLVARLQVDGFVVTLEGPTVTGR